MPQILIQLFIGIVSTFFKMRKQVSNRKKGKSISKATTTAGVSLTANENEKITRIAAFLSSIILTTAFKKLKVWVTHALVTSRNYYHP